MNKYSNKSSIDGIMPSEDFDLDSIATLSSSKSHRLDVSAEKENKLFTIGVLNHDSCDGSKLLISKALAAIEEIKNKNISVDILMGPDYGLVSADAMASKRPNTMHERYDSLRSIKKLSKLIPDTTLMIGTMFWHKKMYTKEEDKLSSPDTTSVSLPIYKNGRLVKELFKERNNTEISDTDNYATLLNRNIIYAKGNHKNNFLKINDKNISVQICGDHGNQNTKGCDIELVHAYDSRAGFYLNSTNDSWSRYAIICDGFSEESVAQHFDANTKKISGLEFSKHNNLDTITLDLYKNK